MSARPLAALWRPEGAFEPVQASTSSSVPIIFFSV